MFICSTGLWNSVSAKGPNNSQANEEDGLGREHFM